jgi:predicted nucleic-acid-binding Zn-ribbon protein
MEKILNCPKCGTEYSSSSSVTCPKCGSQRSASRTKSYTQDAGKHVRGFLKSLLDFRFEKFIYVDVARVVYFVGVVLSTVAFVGSEIWSIVTIAGGLTTRSTSFGDVTIYGSAPVDTGSLSLFIVALPFIYVLEVIALRLSLELGVAIIKIAENTKKN